jgi:hypothetical protein
MAAIIPMSVHQYGCHHTHVCLQYGCHHWT